MPDTLLVTGAGGHLSRLALEHLAKIHAGPIVAASRDPAKLSALAELGIETRRLDFEDAATLADGFRGIDRALIVSTDAIDSPGRRAAQHLAAVDAAVKAGVGRLVYTSMPKPEPGSAVVFAPDHHATEQAIKGSGVAHTILRVSWYQENFLTSLAGMLASSTWLTSAGDGTVPYVAREDAARAAAAALAADTAANETLDVTGPRAWTTAEVAALIARTFGKPIQVVQMEDAALAEQLAQFGLPGFLVSMLVSMDRNTRQGGLPTPTDVVQRLTGTAPRPLEAFFEAQKALLPLSA